MRNISGIDDVEGLLLGELQADSYFSGNEAEMKLQEAILTLPEKQRLVFNMKYFDDLTYEEMEKILETSAGALKASYHHAVKKIEKYLSEERTAKAIIRADELL
jgi:RNA polymerase sigma-70 factor (ECF subfamily)